MDKIIVGKKLKYAREKNNLTMDELKDEFNNLYGASISKSMISSWENGNHLISNKNLDLYTQYFNILSEYFMSDNIKPDEYEKIKRKKEKFDYAEDIVNDFYRSNYSNYNLNSSDKRIKSIFEEVINKSIKKLNIKGLERVAEYINDISKINIYLSEDEE